MKISLTLTEEQQNAMIAHVNSLAPLEACGLLAGKNSTVEKVLPITNQAQSKVRYAMEPIEQLRAFEQIEAEGLDLLGIFHSHPEGPEVISQTDIAEAYYPVVYVVLSRKNEEWKTRGFWIENNSFSEVDLRVI